MSNGAYGNGLKGQESTVHQLFGVTDDRFRAPEFQRHFVWGTDGEDQQIVQFWEDFDKLLSEDEEDEPQERRPALFLGAVVLQVLDPGPPGTGVLYSIIDGQQRITTLYLVLAAITEALEECDDIESAQYLSSEYLLARSPQHSQQARVEPTVSDRGVMSAIMSCLNHPKPNNTWQPASNPTGRLWEAWKFIRGEIRQRIEADQGGRLDTQKLKDLRDQVLHRLEVVTITLGNRHDPHEVYERLNTRGRALSELDLVRNAVFYTTGSDPEAARRIYEHHWDPFESQLAGHQEGFWFPYAMIRNPSTTRARSYRDMKTYWEDTLTGGKQGEHEAQQIVEDLREYLPAFRAIVGISSNDEAQFETDAWQAVARLRRMDVPVVMYPFLMELVHHYMERIVSQEQLVHAIGVVDSFLVRRHFCGLGTQGIHAVFKNLWNSVGDDIYSMRDVLVTRNLAYPSDEEFHEGLRKFKLYRLKSARRHYVLSEYENRFPGDASYPIPTELTTDHLLPQSESAATWPGFSDEEVVELGDTWANLVPLGMGAQRAKGAKNWKEQRELLVKKQGTVYKSTLEVFDRWPDEWTALTLRERADGLADWAMQRWPRQ